MKKNKMDLKNKLRNLGIGLMSVGAIGCNDYKPQEVNTENWKCKAQIVLPITKAEVGSGDSWARYRDRSFGYFRTTSYVSANSETPDEICSYPPSEAEIGGQIFYDLNNEGEVLSGEETNRKFFHPGRILTGITRPPYAPSNDLGSVTFESEPFDAMLSNGLGESRLRTYTTRDGTTIISRSFRTGRFVFRGDLKVKEINLKEE